MIKKIAILILCLNISNIKSQDQDTGFDGKKWIAPYSLPVYEGWDLERFQIPISFAPKIPYQGIEDIRFAPGWAKKTSKEYWSYAFLWYLNDFPKMNEKIIKRNLELYYSGLININKEQYKVSPDKLFPPKASIKKIRKDPGDMNTFKGTIHMLDYMGQTPINLHCIVHIKSCPGQNGAFIFHEISPMAESEEIWNRLHKLWKDFNCMNNEIKK